MNQVATFAILGDSAASGVGDSDKNGVTKGWGYYLAKHFQDPLVYINFSRPGAQSAEVLEDQLPKALMFKPDIAAVIVGGNDALRNRFDPNKLHQNLRATISELKKSGAEVLLLQLHDPTQIVPLPKLLAQVLSRRVNAVNRVIHSVGREFNAQILLTRSIQDIYKRKVWHVDRMHPSKYGHQIMATHFREILLRRNWNIDPITIEETSLSSKKSSIMWMLRNGTPWFFKRSFDLFPAAILLMSVELFKTVFRLHTNELGTLYYPEFSPQSHWDLQEVNEASVS
ncbi:MAG: SGNH/GDSL hydrolase family protein [Actinobacteria bacterium]|nr:SGNH/GDSL hydrolase family protein [Actinomycetota bacterium]